MTTKIQTLHPTRYHSPIHHRSSMSILWSGVACVIYGFLAPMSLSAAESQDTDGTTPDGGRRITLTRSVEPSFHIEPIVQRFEAKRGAVIPFQFLIKSTGKSMDVSVAAVSLRQLETGLVMHDTEGRSPDEIRFTSPLQFKLLPGESHLIQGTVTVPLAKTNFLSYGVLVRDNGMTTGEPIDKSDPTKTSASVRFVTQYVLRVDIETGVKDFGELDHLVFEQGSIRNEKGMPVARTFLTNPTDFAFEFGVRGEIGSARSTKPKPFRFSMPSRSTLQNEEKYLVRVMPRSRIRLDAPVDSLIFPGQQEMRIAVTNGRRSVVEKSFPIEVRGGDFPALETRLAYLSESLSVEPAQIEIGQAAGKKRTCNLRFVNTSEQPTTVAVDIQDLHGQPIEGLRLSSDSFEIKPGRSKTIRATIQSNRRDTSVRFGEVHMQIEGNAVANSLPLAVVNGPKPEPTVELGELQSLEQNGVTSFRLSVTNTGEGFVPVHADLQVADTQGRAYEMADGYGRWLKPGESRELAFVPEHVLEPGDYQLSLQFKTTEDQPPIERTLIVTLDPSTEDSK